MNWFQINCLTLLQKLFACGFMVLMTGAFQSLLIDVNDPNAIDLATGLPVFQYVSAAAYLITALLCITYFKQIKALIWPLMTLTLLMLLLWASTAWSLYPDITLRRATGATGTTLFGIWLACRFKPMDILRLVAWAIGFTAVVSLLVVVFMPSLGVHQPGDLHMGYWRGVFIHKNIMGRWMCLGILAFGWLWYLNPRRSFLVTLGLVACTIGLIGAGSRTAWFTTILFLAIPMTMFYLRQHWTLLLFSTTATVPVAILGLLMLWANLDDIFAAFGRDMTLTGRTTLWVMSWPYILQEPWLGHGFRVFWLTQNESAWIIWSIIEWDPASAHNSFIDLALDLGFVGLGLFLLNVTLVTRWLIMQYRQGDRLAAWHMTFLFYLFVQSVAQTVILSPNTLQWVLYVTIAVFACRYKKPALARQPLPALTETAASRAETVCVR
jgi:exopolysaccharide production protein ExoQ